MFKKLSFTKICLVMTIIMAISPAISVASPLNASFAEEYISIGTVEYANADVSPDVTVSNFAELEEEIFNFLSRWESSFIIRLIGNTDNLSDNINAAIDNVFSENDYIKYNVSKRGFNSSTIAGKSNITFSFDFRSENDQEYLDKKQQEAYVNQAVEDFLDNNIPPGLNQHYIVKRVHDFIVANVEYDMTFQKFTAFAALKQRRSVCQGYALAAYKMLSEAGIDVRIVGGKAGQDGDVENHAWNLVKLDGSWYHLDLTWNDPVPDVPGRVFYHFYNKTDNEMAETHFPDDKKDYPSADIIYYASVLDLIEDFFEDNNIAPGVTKEDVDNAADLIEVFPEGEEKQALELLIDYAYQKLEETENLLVAEEVSNLFAGEDKQSLAEGVDLPKINSVWEKVEDLPEGEIKTGFLADIETAYTLLADSIAPEMVDNLFDETVDGLFIKEELTKKDVDDANFLAKKMTDSPQKTESLAKINSAYSQLARKDVDALFGSDNKDELAVGVTRESIDAARELVEELPDGEEKDEFMAEVERAYYIYAVSVEGKYGNIDGEGEISVSDAILVLRHVVGIIDLAADFGNSALTRAKVSKGDIEDGLSVTDAILILRYVVGIITIFPVEENQQ